MNKTRTGTRYIVKFYYIGSNKYLGSQRQKDYPTIENAIISALKKKEYIDSDSESKIDFASRTDKNVSARGCTFSFTSKKELYLMELNTALPKNIGVWSRAKVPLDFSSRHQAVLRHYRYIYPCFHIIPKHRDLKLLKKTCQILEGTHDFRNFCKKEAEESNTIKTLELATVKMEESFIIFDFKSKSFLRQQIRRMVRKIIETWEGTITIEEFLELLDESRNFSYQPADPKGLILWDILYDENVEFKIDLKSHERMLGYFETKYKIQKLKNKLFSVLQKDDAS
ncbi:MAG: tRNA pseudouridine(38-40) synthase TruA [Promethearchaeota archaeon]